MKEPKQCHKWKRSERDIVCVNQLERYCKKCGWNPEVIEKRAKIAEKKRQEEEKRKALAEAARKRSKARGEIWLH